MSNITIYKSDFDYACNYLVQYLRDAGYVGSLEDGSGIYDVLIKPAALLYTVSKFEADKASAYLSLDRAASFSDSFGAGEYDTAVDQILSNWFVSRLGGQKTTGTIRVYFTQALSYLKVTAGDVLFVVNGVGFTPVQTRVFTSSDFTAYTDTASASVNFYVDVDVQSAAVDGTTVAAGDTVATYIDSGFYLRSLILADFSSGNTGETSEEFIARTQLAITTRELITNRAIATVLLDELPDIRSVYVAGFGVAEQQRDVVEFDNVTAHIGNKADIYVKSNLSVATATCLVATGGHVVTTGITAYVADIISVESIPASSEDTPESYAFTLSGVAETAYGAAGTVPTIKAPSATVGTSVTVSYLTNSAVAAVDALVNSDAQRVACYDPLVRGSYAVRLNIAFSYTLGDTSATGVDASIKTAIINYVNSIEDNTPFIISRMLAAIHTNVSSTLGISLPITVTYFVRNPTTLALLTGSITDQFVLPTGDTVSPQLTWNTMQFYTNTDSITLTQVA